MTILSRGSIMVFALIMSGIIMLVTTSFFGYFGASVHAERYALASAQAEALAEAGMDEAVYQLNQNASYTGENGTTLGSGTFSVSVATINGNTKSVSVTASVPNAANPTATKVVKANVSINSSTVAFRYGVQVGDGGVIMGNGAFITGNLFSSGSVSGGGLIYGDAVVAIDSSTTPDQTWTLQNSGAALGDTAAHTALAQSFKPNQDGTLTKVSLNLKKLGNPSDLAIKIVSDSNGKPSSTVLASGTLPASLVTGSYGLADATLSTSPQLTGSQTYWIVAVATVSSSNYFTWGLDTLVGYSSTAAKSSSNWQSGSWSSLSKSLDFVTYMSGPTTSLSGVWVQGNAYAHTLSSCIIQGNAYYQTLSGCTVSGTKFPGSPDQSPAAMPISDAQIAGWEQQASAGGVIQGAYAPSGNVTLGPKEVNGDLTIQNGATLTLSGPVWVNGNISISNNATLTVAPSLGNSGAILIADATGNTASKGKVSISNNVTISGNGSAGSYPMIISTNTSSDAVDLSNNANSVILYAPYGTVSVSNGAHVSAVTAYQLSINNLASVTYSQGLQNANFSNGPGGSWAVVPGTYVIER